MTVLQHAILTVERSGAAGTNMAAKPRGKRAKRESAAAATTSVATIDSFLAKVSCSPRIMYFGSARLLIFGGMQMPVSPIKRLS